jgi:carbon-monoxide dehydrogenase medium subunit
MKPPVFDYLAPTSVDETLEALTRHGWDAKILAGGQSLVPLLNFRLAEPAVLVDLNGVDELDYVLAGESGSLRVGAMTRQRTLERDPLVAARAPLLAEAVPWIAHPQIRNRGTVGGSLAHADPAAELPVIAVALDATLKIRSVSGTRTVAAAEFFVGLMTTDLAPEEMLVEIEIPAPAPRSGWAFVEIARRRGDYAQAGVATVVTLDGSGDVASARLVYLTAGETPMSALRAAELLVRNGLTEESIAEAAAVAAHDEIEPTDDIHATAEFKVHLAEVVTRRALAVAHRRALEAA